MALWDPLVLLGAMLAILRQRVRPAVRLDGPGQRAAERQQVAAGLLADGARLGRPRRFRGAVRHSLRAALRAGGVGRPDGRRAGGGHAGAGAVLRSSSGYKLAAGSVSLRLPAVVTALLYLLVGVTAVALLRLLLATATV